MIVQWFSPVIGHCFRLMLAGQSENLACLLFRLPDTNYRISLLSGNNLFAVLIMPLNKFIIAISHGCLILTSTSAHRLCPSCISLNNLLAEAYGIEISTDGL